MATLETSAPNPIRQPKVAVVGCGHGQLDTIYADMEVQCSEKGWDLLDLDFLIICGDFQAVRNQADLNCMSVPRRYRKLGDFHKYYSGEAKAPVLTLVIGGNHEASNYLFELYHGGWLAPNIYYLGAAGVVRYGPWRIAAMSGIYSSGDYGKPHGERLPYEREHIKSIYHVRDYNVQRLMQIRSPVDIGLSHDWPAWVELFGDHNTLYVNKPHFLDSAKADNLGSKPAAEVMDHIRPSYWFSGHMHIRFSATVEHKHDVTIKQAINALDVPDSLRNSLPVFKTRAGSASRLNLSNPAELQPKTEFLALHKAGGAPPHKYMDVRELELPVRPGSYCTPLMDTDDEGKFHLCYDEEWLAITRAYADALRVADPETLVVPPSKPKPFRGLSASIPSHKTWVKENITAKGLLRIPDNFAIQAPVHNASDPDTFEQPLEYPNQQTATFTSLLQIPNKFSIEG